MHEIVKYFILTEIQEQCLNPMPEPLIGPGRPAEYTHATAAAAMVSTDHTKMVKWPPWGRILHLPYLPIPKLVFLT